MEKDPNLKVIKAISSGSFGKVYRAWSKSLGEMVAVKVEKRAVQCSVIGYEAKLVKLFQNWKGFPKFYSYEKRQGRKYIVMEFLGPSIDFIHFKNLKFSLKTTLMIAEQLLTRIQMMHSKGYINRDIKPDNLVLGIGNNYRTVYMIDFGLWKRYLDQKIGSHIKMRSGRSLVGTARYASLNSHLGNELSRRDDLESFLYVIVYLFRGSLPWQNVQGQKEYRYKRIGDLKTTYPKDKLFRHLPPEFSQILQYVMSLEFELTPDYSYIRYSLLAMYQAAGFKRDYVFDWNLKINKKTLSNGSDSISISDSLQHESNAKEVKNAEEEPSGTNLRPEGAGADLSNQSSLMMAFTNTLLVNMVGDTQSNANRNSYSSNGTEEDVFQAIKPSNSFYCASEAPKRFARQIAQTEKGKEMCEIMQLTAFLHIRKMESEVLAEQYTQVWKTLEIYKMQLAFKDKELRKAHNQIQLLKGVLSTLKDDVNLKNEQFDYLFKGIFASHDSSEEQIHQQDEKFQKSLAVSSYMITQRFGYFKFLPTDVLWQILSLLEFEDLWALGKVNKEMRDTTRQKELWKPLYHTRWGAANGDWDSYSSRHTLETAWYYRRPVVATLPGHTGAVTTISLVNSTRFISGADDGSAFLWARTQHDPEVPMNSHQHHKQSKPYQKLMSFFGHGGPIWWSTITPTNKLATGSYDKTVKLWNLENGKWENTLRGHSEWVSWLDTDQGFLYTGSWDATVRIWNLQTKMWVSTLHSAMGNAVYWLRAGRQQVLAGGRRNTIDIWDVESTVVALSLYGHTNVINAVHRDDSLAISGSTDATTCLWDLRTGHATATLKSHTSHVMTLAMDSSAHRLATGSLDKTIHIWDLRKLESPRRSLEGHSSAIFSLQMDSSHLISGSGDKTVRIWSYQQLSNKQMESAETVKFLCPQPPSKGSLRGSKVFTGLTPRIQPTLTSYFTNHFRENSFGESIPVCSIPPKTTRAFAVKNELTVSRLKPIRQAGTVPNILELITSDEGEPPALNSRRSLGSPKTVRELRPVFYDFQRRKAELIAIEVLGQPSPKIYMVPPNPPPSQRTSVDRLPSPPRRQVSWIAPPKPVFRKSKPKPSQHTIEKQKLRDVEICAKVKELLPAQFSALLSESNGIEVAPSISYRYYISVGNNGAMVKHALHARGGWTKAESIDQANFVWTQGRKHEFFQQLETGRRCTKGSSITELKPRSLLARKIASESERLGYFIITKSPLFRLLPTTITTSSDLKLCNKLEHNYHLSNKKALLANLVEFLQEGAWTIIPQTWHITTGLDDPNYTTWRDSKPGVWIVKPGEHSNRGHGIIVTNNPRTVSTIIAGEVAKPRETYIIQRYITNPLLYHKRKFDIRVFALVTSINGNLQAYYFKEGYIRTSGKEWQPGAWDDRTIHLTNDAVQKRSEEYGKFENGNKLSYAEFDKYLQATHSGHDLNEITKQIRALVITALRAVMRKLDPNLRRHSFELFGFDYMVDSDFHVWLLEVNTNPCLDTGPVHLARIIPSVIDNLLRLVVDPYFSRKKAEISQTENKFELIYNLAAESEEVIDEEPSQLSFADSDESDQDAN